MLTQTSCGLEDGTALASCPLDTLQWHPSASRAVAGVAQYLFRQIFLLICTFSIKRAVLYYVAWLNYAFKDWLLGFAQGPEGSSWASGRAPEFHSLTHTGVARGQHGARLRRGDRGPRGARRRARAQPWT